MKSIKTIISVMLISAGLVLIGELGLEYVNNFQNDIPSTTFFFQNGMQHDEMKRDILEAAKEYNISFFVIKNEVISINRKNIIIYQSDSAVGDWLSANKKISEKQYNSLFMGYTSVSFSDYKKISNSDLEANHVYFAIGGRNEIKSFKISLIDKYAGNHPLFPGRQNKYTYTVFGIWTIIFTLNMLLTIVYAQNRKKEVFIRVINGENRLGLILKESVSDLLFIYAAACVIQKLLLPYTESGFYSDCFYLFSGIFAAANTGVYMSFLRYEIQKIYGEKSLMCSVSLLYFLKPLTIIAVSLFLTTYMVTIKEAVSFISQEDFFEKYKDYYYTNISYVQRLNSQGEPEKSLEDTVRIKEIFYKKKI